MSEIKLLPCPFCGCWAAVHYHKFDGKDEPLDGACAVKCENADCMAAIGDLTTKAKAIIAWNRRAIIAIDGGEDAS